MDMKILPWFLSFCFFFSNVSSHGLPLLRVPVGVQLSTFDQSEAEDFVTLRILLNLGSGLVQLDKTLKPKPSLAKLWTVSKDNKIYKFYLRKTYWSDGQLITAKDFVRGFEHTFSPTTTAKLATPLLELISGATKYKRAEIKDFSQVGVRAIAPDQLEVTLNHPAPYFLATLALPMAFPSPRQSPDYQIKIGTPTSGPYILDSVSQGKITLSPNLKSWEPAQNRLEFVVVSSPSTGFTLYLKKELDLLEKIPGEEYTTIQKNLELHTAPWLSTYYLGFNLSKPPFNNKTLRQAFIEAIDRDQTVSLLLDPQQSATSFIPAPLIGSDKQYGPKYNRQDAKIKYLSTNETKTFILDFDSQDKNTLIATHIQQQIKDVLGARLELHQMEWKSYLRYLKEAKPSFFRFAWLASFPDPLSHLQVFESDSPNNYTGYKNPKYDLLVSEIGRCPEGKRRQQLIEEAQNILLTEDMVIMPLFHYLQHVLIGDRWQGLDLTPMGILYFHRASLRSSL